MSVKSTCVCVGLCKTERQQRSICPCCPPLQAPAHWIAGLPSISMAVCEKGHCNLQVPAGLVPASEVQPGLSKAVSNVVIMAEGSWGAARVARKGTVCG